MPFENQMFLIRNQPTDGKINAKEV